MYDFIRIQFELGNLTVEQIKIFVPKWITWEQASEIVGEELNIWQ